MSDDYEWLRNRRRRKRQEELRRDDDDLDQRLGDGFDLLREDDDFADENLGARHLSSLAECEHLRNSESGEWN